MKNLIRHLIVVVACVFSLIIPTNVYVYGIENESTESPQNIEDYIFSDVVYVSAYSKSTNEVILNWMTTRDKPEFYNVYSSKTENGEYIKIGSTTKCEYIDKTLKAGELRYYKVTQVKSGTESNYSNTAGSRTAYKKDGPIVMVQATGTSTVYLNWIGIVSDKPIAGYFIYASESENGPYRLKGASYFSEFTHQGLKPGTKMYYQIKSVTDDFEEYAFSSIESVTTFSKPRRPSIWSSGSDVSSNSVTIRFDFPDERIDYCNIYASTSKDGKYVNIGKTSNSTQRYYTHSGLKPGTTTYYKLTTVSSGKESDFSLPVAFKTSVIKPQYPKTISAVAKSKSEIKIDWSDVKGADYYNVYTSTSTNGKYTKIAKVSGKSYIHTKLKSNQKVYYKIKAVDNGVESEFSKVVYATTKK